MTVRAATPRTDIHCDYAVTHVFLRGRIQFMRKRDFYKDWVLRAFSGRLKTAEYASGLATIPAIAIALLWETADHYINIIPVTIFGGTLVILIFSGLILSPYWIAKDQYNKIKKLEERIEPKIDILFQDEKPYKDTGKFFEDYDNRQQTIARISVKNLSESDCIDDVHVQIDEIYNENISFKSLKLRLMHEDKTNICLSPLEETFFNVACWPQTHTPGKRQKLPKEELNPNVAGYSYENIHFDEDGNEKVHNINIFIHENAENQIKPGKYIIKLTAFGKNTPPVRKKFLLGISEKWEMIFKEANSEEETKWFFRQTET